MYSISRFRSLLNEVPRKVFADQVKHCGSDRYSKGFDSWSQLVAMVYGHLSGAASLRMIEHSYNSQSQHHYHLGTGSIRRSTLADANSKRSPAPFVAVAQALMSQAHRKLRREGTQLLYLLDSTSITLKGRHFDAWTAGNRTRNTQGVKLHLLYNRDTQAPAHHSITAANINDVNEGQKLPIETGAVYVFDKGYCDYNWWAQIEAKGAHFVTRFKRDAAARVVETRPVPTEDAAHILCDEVVHFAHKHPGAKRKNRYTKPLRRVTVARPDKATPLILATNDLDSPATRIAQHYKDRWGVELFFKWIKQHLKIKQTFGCSENAVKIQILCALIAYLLLTLYRKAHGLTASLWAILGELRVTLFQRPRTERQAHRRRKRARIDLEQIQVGLFS